MNLNWTNCDNNYYSLDTLLMALHGEVSDAPFLFRGLKVCMYGSGEETPEEVITCDTQDSWIELFRQSLTYADDGTVALRAFAWYDPYDRVPQCANGEQLEDILRTSFVKVDGLVHYVVFPACSAPPMGG